MSGRYIVRISPDEKHALVTSEKSADGSQDEIRVHMDYSSAQKRRGRSLAKHIQALLNEHPHEWPKNRAKKSECTHEHHSGCWWQCDDCGHTWRDDGL